MLRIGKGFSLKCFQKRNLLIEEGLGLVLSLSAGASNSQFTLNQFLMEVLCVNHILSRKGIFHPEFRKEPFIQEKNLLSDQAT